ncbi:AraC family transcriptional regulator [Pseudidiomarina sediminum]|uniref:AraC family transcriptional regulator n=1 Tax=Pseudidiomarina sediminum TaxID=431675 RepID=A0A432Z9E8_9GAMM|nr:AraC family transcriptional regulator [Pseudidiomarina sediminum]
MESEDKIVSSLTLDTAQWDGASKWQNWKYAIEKALPYDCELSLNSDPACFEGHLEVFHHPLTHESYSDVTYSGNQVRRTKQHLQDGYNDYILMFVKSGEGSFQSEGEVYWFKPNSIYLVDTSRPFSKDMYGGCQVVFIRIAKDRIDPAFPQLSTQAVRAFPTESGPGMLLRNYLYMLPRAVHTSTESTIDFLFRALTNLVVANLMELSEQLPERNYATTDHAFFVQVLKHMRQHFTDPNFRLSNLVAHYQRSRSYFYQLFKEHGTTFSDELRALRIEYAANRLATASATMADLAYECGFNGASQFSRAFKVEMGVTPQKFRLTQL